MEEGKDSRDLTRVSRRGFIKGVGTGLVGSALLGGAADEATEVEAAPASESMGPGVVSMTLHVNGQDRAVRAEPRTTLANVLRNELDLTGTKFVCDRGSCGGCTVMVDGKAVYSCMMLAVDAIGKKVTTVEGLAPSGGLDPVQAAFVEKDALMCGFCTPGFVVSIRSLLNTNTNPTLEDVKAACAGNICRCGTYSRVFEAALAAAQRVRQGG
jgi:aerobic-type carbon monoxide dehydrogenase small subunit (CoxS/CutS family)